ncbi:MAG: lysophospholipid acyltransferase family protein [Gemmatimonadaceae bacterium]
MNRLVNAWIWTTTVLVVLFGFLYVALVWLVTAPFDRGRYAAGRAFRQLAVAGTWLNPYWKFETSGVRIRDPRRPYVAVSNHESYADIFLISHLPWEMKWLSKDTIFRIPVMGWMMSMVGDIPLKRGSRDSVEQALAGCRDRLARKVSLMIFPEGTRSRTAELLPFRDGAFRLAVESGVPILPIAVAGTRHAMAKGSFRFERAHARCRVLEPVETTGLTVADVPALRERVKATIDEARRGLMRELGITPETDVDAPETPRRTRRVKSEG